MRMRERRTMVRATAAGAAVLLLGGCGSEPHVDGPGDAAPPAAEWTTQAIDLEQGADRELQLATWGDEVVLVGTTEDDVLQSWSGRAGTDLAEGTPLPTEVTYLSLGGTARLGNRWLTLGSGGLEEVDGDGELLFEAHAYRSEDGGTWEPLDVMGFSGPMEVQELVARGDRWVAVGNRRGAEDPSSGGFEARAWWSTDGEAWTEVALPTSSNESVATDVAVIGDRLLAVGHDGDDPAMWSSSDGGASWTAASDAALEEVRSLRFIAVHEDTVVVTGSPRLGAEEDESTAGSVLLRSTDGGETWAAAGQPPPTEDTEGWLPLQGGGDGRFLATTSSFLESWSRPEVCYADIDRCRMDSVEALYESTGGDTWRRVDPSGLGEGEAGEVWAIETAEDGTVVAVTWDEGLRLSTWPGGIDLPTMDEPSLPTTELVQLDEGEEPEVGVAYAAPLHVHCGMGWLYLGDEPWQRTDDGPDVETGAGDPADPDWPIAQQTIFGFATVLDDGTLEYSIGDLDGEREVIATYGPPSEDPPMCD
jgi:photosystem II stability/assembly factor-like uncharacterized protein